MRERETERERERERERDRERFRERQREREGEREQTSHNGSQGSKSRNWFVTGHNLSSQAVDMKGK
jgi:hypothetical protein